MSEEVRSLKDQNQDKEVKTGPLSQFIFYPRITYNIHSMEHEGAVSTPTILDVFEAPEVVKDLLTHHEKVGKLSLGEIGEYDVNRFFRIAWRGHLIPEPVRKLMIEQRSCLISAHGPSEDNPKEWYANICGEKIKVEDLVRSAQKIGYNLVFLFICNPGKQKLPEIDNLVCVYPLGDIDQILNRGSPFWSMTSSPILEGVETLPITIKPRKIDSLEDIYEYSNSQTTDDKRKDIELASKCGIKDMNDVAKGVLDLSKFSKLKEIRDPSGEIVSYAPEIEMEIDSENAPEALRLFCAGYLLCVALSFNDSFRVHWNSRLVPNTLFGGVWENNYYVFRRGNVQPEQYSKLAYTYLSKIKEIQDFYFEDLKNRLNLIPKK